MSIYSMFGTDERTAEEGKWVVFAPGVEFKIRRVKSAISRKVRNRLYAAYPHIDKVPLTEEQEKELIIRHLAEALVADWRGHNIVDTNGDILPYSVDNAIKLFTALPELADAVAEFSMKVSNYRDEVKDTAKGN